MVLTPSSMVALGAPMPHFRLPEPGGQIVDSHTLDGPVLVMFICNHCPYVKHIADRLGPLSQEFMDRGLHVIGINSNDVENYPDDAPELMIEEKRRRGWPFPYLFDETQEVAKAFDAQCTPDLFLYDAGHRLVYRGQFDATRPGQGTATGEAIERAVGTMLAGGTLPEQLPSIGCNIKWR